MKKQILVFVYIVCLIIHPIDSKAQVGINTDGSQPDPSAGLDVSFTNKGFLPPRVALSAINSAEPIATPAVGLFVYNTAIAGIAPNNITQGYYCWDGVKWLPVLAPRGINIGDMQYWNGTSWVTIPAGSYGQQLFFCNGVPTWGGCVPLLTTAAVASITANSAISGGIVTNDGGTNVTVRGVCWGTSTNPTTANSKTIDGNGTGSFVSNLTELIADTLYYVRAYSTNSVGTSYGNQLSFTTPSFTIGQSYAGGIIFYIDGSGQHGLIAATSDQSSGAQWGCEGTIIGTGSNIGTGQANTDAIVNGCSMAGTAAQICNDLVLNGYSDWFLPSIAELNLMYLQKSVIGGFANDYYWSSTEVSDIYAWERHFGFGVQYDTSKGGVKFVRAVRAF